MATQNIINNTIEMFAFSAYQSFDRTTVTGSGTNFGINCDTITYNSYDPLIGPLYDAPSGLYYIPRIGMYVFSGNIAVSGIVSQNTSGTLCLSIATQTYLVPMVNNNPYAISVVGVTQYNASLTIYMPTLYQSVQLNIQINGNATDNIDLLGGSGIGTYYGTSFSGYKLP